MYFAIITTREYVIETDFTKSFLFALSYVKALVWAKIRVGAHTSLKTIIPHLHTSALLYTAVDSGL